MAFESSPSPNSTSEVPIVFGGSIASPQVSTANLSDAIVYAFLANQPNRSQLVHEDLEQIHEDDLEEMDLKWQLALLSMRAKGNFQKTAMVEIDGAGFDWSYMADDEAPTNMAFMALLDSESDLGYVSYNVVLPPHTRRFSPLRIDLYHTGLPDFAEPSVKSYRVTPTEVVTQTSSVKIFSPVKENISAPFIEDWESDKEDEVESPAEKDKKNVESSVNKRERMVNGTNHSRVNHNATTVPKAMLTRTGLKPVNFVRPVNPKRNFFNKINTANEKVNTARPNLAVLNVVRANKGKAGHSHRQIEDQGYFDSGCSRHMTGNISYLTDFKEFDGGYVAFWGGAKGGKITGKGIIRTSKLDFKDVYFVKELQFNLYSLSQMCEKKNSVLFTDTECFILSHDFKLADESHVLLNVPKNNMYNVDIKNIVPKNDLTCIIAKATNDESMLWHRRLDHLGKFDGKSDEGFFVGYSTNSKAFRVYNTRTRKVEENLHIKFLENKPLIAGDGPKWLFNVDTLTELMNYVPVSAGTNFNDFAGKGASFDAGQSSLEEGPSQDYSLMPLWNDGLLFDSSLKDSDGANLDTDDPSTESKIDNQDRPNDGNSPKDINTIGPSINIASSVINTASLTVNTVRISDDYFGANKDMKSLDEVEIDISNLSITYHVPMTLNTRINKDHSLDNVIEDMQFGVQTRRMTVTTDEQGFISAIYEEKTHVDLHTCLFACFLSQEEPKRITNALKDPAWVEAMQEELMQFHLQKVWTLVDMPRGESMCLSDFPDCLRPFKTLCFVNYALILRQDYDITSSLRRGALQFLYGKIEEEVYVCQPPGFEDPDYPDKAYKVEKALYGMHQAPRACQDKYLDEILRKFKYEDVKPTRTLTDKEKDLLKYSDGDDVDVYLYKSMIGSLTYLTSSRPDIMFDVCTCAKFQVTPKVLHLHAVKRIFRYLKGHPKLGLWYPKDSSFDLVAYTDSDYASASLDRKSTSEGCQILGSRLISWPCKKQTMVATSTIEDEYVAAASCCGVYHHIWLSLILDKKMIKDELSTGFDKHNMVAFLQKPQGSEDFHKIVDFLKASHIRKTGIRTGRMGIRISQSNVPSSAIDEAITKEMHDRLRRATTTASSLAVEDSPVQARPERLSNLPNEPPLEEGNTSRRGEGSMQYLELMEICTKLSEKVTSLENELTSIKAVYNKALITLTKRGRMIKKLDKVENVNLVQSSEQREAQKTTEHRMEFSNVSPHTTDDETLVETLLNIKRSAAKDKRKGIMQEPDLPKKIKKRERIQLSLDEELAQKLYAEELAKETARQEQEKYNLEKALKLQK
nr:uncharacterized mitochondrial protein AtMg00810-like [Tanacetum cinerariifolium]